MNARDTILARIRENRPAGAHPRPDVPRFPMLHDGRPLEQGEHVDVFETNLKAMGGKPAPSCEDDIAALVRTLFPKAGVVASRVPELVSDLDVAACRPQDLAWVDVAVVRAAFAIVETGSILLSEEELGVNALAYLAQHLLVLLDPADLVASTQDAYHRPEFKDRRYAAFHTGPSATADIEGVLIHGAQGVRSLTVAMRPRT
ncbi:LutC/YkgG family protein [Methylobacterium sp. NPDC080182]|uniref:LutC/YkgG family protein n=1 Tax=Methylobacterium sp. NPDC080182 TaxID=3390590 RepID=UPI003D00D8DC